MNERHRGFTLIEALLGMIVVALTILTLYAMIPFTFKSVEMNAAEVQAVAVGQRYLDYERNAKLHNLTMPSPARVPIDPGDSFVSSSSAAGGDVFTVTPDGCATVQTFGLNANVYSCSATVTWTQTGATRTVTVQSYVTK